MMIKLLLVAILQIPSVTVKEVAVPPKLDGVIDSVWSTADSIFQFHQFEPDWGKPPRFRTVVKFLQDAKNLYILAIGYTGKEHPVANASQKEDRITIYLDTFLSRQEAYFFSVTAGGTQYDGIVSENGNRWNMNWEGYWFAKARVYPHKYVVEMKIPFRSIRYAQGLDTWGLQARRYIPQYFENDYWVLPPREKEDEVSQYGQLKGIHPGSYGYGMEFYPVGILKRERYGSASATNTLTYGLDYTWNITSDAQLNLTFKPDFAQIEADPFALNLSKYERYLSERRPFFIEANEVFKTTRLGAGDLIRSPFTVFYSRRIGKKLPDGTDVPIDFGSKFTFKATGYQIGFMSVYTEGKAYTIDNTSYEEPPTLWNVLRLKATLMGNSPAGILIASKWADPRGRKLISTNYDLDGKFVYGNYFTSYQIVRSSPAEGRSGIGAMIAENYIGKNWGAAASIQYIDKYLDLSSTGYMNADPGVSFNGVVFKKTYHQNSSLLSTTDGIVFTVGKRPDDPVWIKGGFLYRQYIWRDGKYTAFSIGSGNTYEFGENKPIYNLRLEAGKMGGKVSYGSWNNLVKAWNYNLGIYAWQGIGGIWSDISLTGSISSGFNFRYWAEFDTSNKLHDIYTTFRPWIEWSVSRVITITASSEIVTIKTETWKVYETRLGLRFVYKFRPKSRIYVVVNRHLTNAGESLVTDQEFYAFKIRWAIPF